MLYNTDNDLVISTVQSEIISTLHNLAPIITISPTRKLLPWVTALISKMQSTAKRLYDSCHRTEARLQEYRDTKHAVNILIYNAKTTFYKNRLIHLQGSNKI